MFYAKTTGIDWRQKISQVLQNIDVNLMYLSKATRIIQSNSLKASFHLVPLWYNNKVEPVETITTPFQT